MNKNQWPHLLQQLHTYSGRYECHLTVDMGLRDTEQLREFEQLCYELNAKPVVIQLSSGLTPTQPMLGRFFQGEPEVVLESIRVLTATLQKHFTVLRLKVEAGIDNANIPQTDADITGLSKSCYFEHHVKMLLATSTDQGNLRSDLTNYQGHLSRNAYSAVADPTDLEYRFVTQRYWRGNDYAEQQLSRLLSFLQQQDITVDKVIREFNIFDSHLQLDAGWITP